MEGHERGLICRAVNAMAMERVARVAPVLEARKAALTATLVEKVSVPMRQLGLQ